MLIIGGIVGFAVCFVFVAVPLAVTMSTQLGLQYLLPVIGTAPAAVVALNIPFAVLLHIIIVLLAYITAATATPVPTSGPVAVAAPGTTPSAWEFTEQFGRGALIGINACANLILLPVALPWIVSWNPTLFVLSVAAMPLLGIAAISICIVNLMALFEGFCAEPWYAAVLGWSAWLAPTAWAASFVGLLFTVISLIAAGFGMPLRFDFEWWTGTLVVHGGPMHVAKLPTAYNLGNIVFIDPRLQRMTPILISSPVTVVHGYTADGIIFHETGHTLNVAAFGSWFHYIGAIHEGILGLSGLGPNAYAELLPEGHSRGSTRAWFPLWAPPVGLGGTVSNTPPAVPSAMVDGFTGAAPIVVAAGATLTLSGGAPSDPDGYYLAAVNPGISTNVGVLWAFSRRPNGSAAAVVGPNLTNTTANVDIGGDYSLVYALTDGMELDAGAETVQDELIPNFFQISVVQAVIHVAPTGVPYTSIPITATGSTAGSAGALPGSGSTAPDLIIAWTADSPNLVIANPDLAHTSVQTSVAGTYNLSLTVTTTGGVSHTATAEIVIA
jgi:hypothetical protein